MKKTIILFVTLIILAATGCKKEGNPSPSLLGKWDIVNIRQIYTSTTDGSVRADQNYTGKTSDYYNFKDDGKVSFSYSGNNFVLDYTLTSDNKVKIDNIYYKIQSLTAHDAQLIAKVDAGNNVLWTETINLER